MRRNILRSFYSNRILLNQGRKDCAQIVSICSLAEASVGRSNRGIFSRDWLLATWLQRRVYSGSAAEAKMGMNQNGNNSWFKSGFWSLASGLGAVGAGIAFWQSQTSECAIPEIEVGVSQEGRNTDREDAHVPRVVVEGKDCFDHVILGGGTAGCVIAYLLGKWIDDQKMNSKVLLVDGGPGYDVASPRMQDWYRNWGEFGKVHESDYSGHENSKNQESNKEPMYPITPSDHRGLGGCGAHDTRIYYLPAPEEQRMYAKVFGWSDLEFKSYMQTAMNLEPAIKTCPNGEKYFDMVLETLNKELGMKRLRDDRFYGHVVPDSAAYFDVGAYDLNDTEAARWTPALLINDKFEGVRPKSLTVLTNAEIDRVEMKNDGKPLVDKVYVRIHGKEHAVHLKDTGSITLSAGSIGNSTILQRSGIGDPEVLNSNGIKTVIPHPEVGHGIDHEEIAVQYAPPKQWPGGHIPAGGVMGWALGIFKRLEGLEQLMQAHFSIAGPPYDDEITVVGTPNNTKPELSLGYRVKIQSRDPHEAARLKYEFSKHEREVFLKGVKEMVIMFEALKNAGLVGERVEPPPKQPDGSGIDLADDDAVWEWIHQNKGTAYHWLGTCKAGLAGLVKPGAVADEKFRLRAGTNQEQVIENFFLSSAAVLPFPPTANPHVTIQTFAVAEAWHALQYIAQTQGKTAALPAEIKEAQHQVQNNGNNVQIRGPGEEKPSIKELALRYYSNFESEE